MQVFDRDAAAAAAADVTCEATLYTHLMFGQYIAGRLFMRRRSIDKITCYRLYPIKPVNCVSKPRPQTVVKSACRTPRRQIAAADWRPLSPERNSRLPCAKLRVVCPEFVALFPVQQPARLHSLPCVFCRQLKPLLLLMQVNEYFMLRK